LLFGFLKDRSRIVQAFAVTALADFAENDAALRSRVAPMIQHAAASDSPSLKARARKLLKRLGRETSASAG
jgi:hypothetical protein